MANYRMVIEYDGTDFCGWQVQPGQRTVQGEIEAALRHLFGCSVPVTGASRTDSGVHARGQVANFRAAWTREVAGLRSAINALTGDDVYIRCLDPAAEDFHARFSARGKEYRYTFIREPFPLLARYAWHVPYDLDWGFFPDVRRALLGAHDFSGLATPDEPEGKSRVCDVREIALTGDRTCTILIVEADRFLRRMMRGIAGLVVDIARGRYSPDVVHRFLSGLPPDRYFAPPQGLCLARVGYDNEGGRP